MRTGGATGRHELQYLANFATKDHVDGDGVGFLEFEIPGYFLAFDFGLPDIPDGLVRDGSLARGITIFTEDHERSLAMPNLVVFPGLGRSEKDYFKCFHMFCN